MEGNQDKDENMRKMDAKDETAANINISTPNLNLRRQYLSLSWNFLRLLLPSTILQLWFVCQSIGRGRTISTPTEVSEQSINSVSSRLQKAETNFWVAAKKEWRSERYLVSRTDWTIDSRTRLTPGRRFRLCCVRVVRHTPQHNTKLVDGVVVVGWSLHLEASYTTTFQQQQQNNNHVIIQGSVIVVVTFQSHTGSSNHFPEIQQPSQHQQQQQDNVQTLHERRS